MNIDIILKSFDAQCEHVVTQLYCNKQKTQVLIFNHEVHKLLNENNLEYTYDLLISSTFFNIINEQLSCMFIDIVNCERKKYE